jgi:signal transduction histidine kinase
MRGHGVKRFAFWAVGLAVLLIVLFNVQGWWLLNRTSRMLEQELGARLQAVAMTLSQAQTGAARGADVRRLYRTVMRDNGLFNLFLVNDRLEYTENLSNPELVGRTNPALQLDMADILSAFSGMPTQSRLYRAGDYYLKTAYAPLVDSLGSIATVLGVEADARFFTALTGFRRTMFLVNILSLLAISAIVLVSASLARHALRVEQAAARANTLALMGQMSATVAHEIKNPLAIIRSTAELLKKRYGAGRDDPEFDYIQSEVDRLAGVVTNYMGLGRHSPGAVQPLDIGVVINGVVRDLEAQAGKLGTKLTADVDDLPQVTGNRNELRQVFLNLVLNGIQAQPDGGRVEVSARVDRQRGHNRVVVRVVDSGSGIDPKTARRVFEPFYTTREKGSGLGLFVVKRIVEEHRGRVKIEMADGGGTVVEISLPT